MQYYSVREGDSLSSDYIQLYLVPYKMEMSPHSGCSVSSITTPSTSFISTSLPTTTVPFISVPNIPVTSQQFVGFPIVPSIPNRFSSTMSAESRVQLAGQGIIANS